MKVFVRSKFDCTPDLVWAEVQTSRLLEEVMFPLLRFLPADGKPFPTRWPEGATCRGNLRFLGVIPLGGHSIFFERIDPSNRQIQTREKGPWIRLWDHLISVGKGAKG